MKHQRSGAFEKAFSRLRRAIFNDYAYRDLHAINWRQRFARFQRRGPLVRTPGEFAKAACDLLKPAKDIHLWLRLNGKTLPTYRRPARRNVAMETLPGLVPGWHQHNATVMSGEFPDGIFYLCIRSWPGSARRQLRPAYEVLRRACATGKALILDVRANSGGSEPAAARFASRFLRLPSCYASHLTCRAGRFKGPIRRWLKPATVGARFRGPVAVLVGPGTVSSCESFALMMKQVPGCKLIGGQTPGASGNPRPVSLGSGMVLLVPGWQDLTPDGRCLEGVGVAPDIKVRTRPTAFGRDDPVLSAALDFLRGIRACEECGSRVPADAPEGLCPTCLFKTAMLH